MILLTWTRVVFFCILTCMSRAFYLFARPSFLEGVGRLMDFGGTLNNYNESLTSEDADRCALGLDYAAVTDELRDAVQKVSVG